MKVKLSVLERLVLLQILPVKGSLLTAKIIDDLRRRLNLDAKEKEHLNAKEENGSITWTLDKDKGVDFEFGRAEQGVIIAALKKLDEEENVEERHIPLFEKFKV